MSWRCATCDKLFETIPEDTVLLSKGAFSRVTVYRFADGTIHSLRQGRSAQTIHKTWHKISKKLGCEFCFPLPEPEPEPEPQPELPVEVLAELPELPASIPEQIEDEDVESLTPMQMAFRRQRTEP